MLEHLLYGSKYSICSVNGSSMGSKKEIPIFEFFTSLTFLENGAFANSKNKIWEMTKE